jgi:F-box-like
MLQAQTDGLASSVQSPTLLPIRDPSILRLPVELTLIIFNQCGSDVKARLSLSHTCRHWMSIMSKSNALWTDIQIIANHPADSRQFGNLISLLYMQLDRTAGKPLDVVWESDQPLAHLSKLLDLLRLKGPFSRWRTLQIHVRAGGHDDDEGEENIFHPGDAFSNLESITIFPSFRSSIFRVLNRTTTSKLQVLDHCPTGSPGEVTLLDCTDMVRRIFHLKTTFLVRDSLPSNITHLDTTYEQSHRFPHLTTYRITTCIFSPTHPADLRCLETLKTAALRIFDDIEVSLPALRYLTCGIIQLQEGSKIITPLLESMHISEPEAGDSNDPWPLRDYTGEAIKNEGFLFSPSHSLTVESILPLNSIIKLLEQSPRVERVSLGFDHENCAMRALERIGGANSEDSLLCGRLRELRLIFSWDKCDVGGWESLTFLWEEDEVESWKERAARVVKMRMRSGIVLRIYASWKGEGTYVLLA